MYRKLSAPAAVQWEVTPSCNHLCVWCYNFWREGDPLPSLPDDYEVRYSKVVDELIRMRVFSVIITGGEPMMVIERVAPFIKRLSDAGIHIYLNSNLTLLSPERAQLIKDAGVRSILVSLPSADPETCDRLTNSRNAVDRTTRGIKIALEFGFPVMVNMVVSRDNLHQVRMTAEYVASLGVKRFAATRASNPVAGSSFADRVLDVDEFRQMLSMLDEVAVEFGFRTDTIEANPPCAFGREHIDKSHRYCGAGRNTCTIGFDGSIRPCNRLPMSYGDIMDGLDVAWSAMDNCRSDEWLPDECAPCPLKLRCGGGCKADALVEYGDLKKPDPLCDLTFMPEPKAWDIQPVEGDEFRVNPNLQVRLEDFGAIVFTGVSSWLAVDRRMVNLFTSGQEVIELADIAGVLQTSDGSARMSAALLVKKHILIPVV
ncbi:MAG: Antilisterial bacteriocin subtilosin biosynthesis protein AlbA [Microgenomates group bacterium ADurb.Bin238]|nr:MAG: Antilisterial bacteriocin subtilosin biosynthesis protein AlbA [Microgenomates group bacterium ADurb.Bin238]